MTLRTSVGRRLGLPADELWCSWRFVRVFSPRPLCGLALARCTLRASFALRRCPTLRLRARRTLRKVRFYGHTDPGFNSSLWTYGLFALVGGVVLYRLGGTKKGEEETSALTQFIESLTTPSEETAANNQRHLDWTIKKAESQLLLQDAQKPPAHRIMNLTYVYAWLTQCV